MSIESEKQIKAILLGNSGVGKTNLINTCTGFNFEEDYESTSCCSYRQKILEINDKKYIINLWDTAGQELYRAVTKIFIKGSHLVIFVYDITNKESFESLNEWIGICNNLIDNQYIAGIAGNKKDLYMQEQVNEEEARKYAEEKKMPFSLVSAKDDPKSFELFLKDLILGDKVKDLDKEEEKKEKDKSISLKSEKLSEQKKRKKKYCFGLFG